MSFNRGHMDRITRILIGLNNYNFNFLMKFLHSPVSLNVKSDEKNNVFKVMHYFIYKNNICLLCFTNAIALYLTVYC